MKLFPNLLILSKNELLLEQMNLLENQKMKQEKFLQNVFQKKPIFKATLFDTATGEVSVEAKRPWLLQRNAKEFNHADLTEKIGWRLRIRKATTIPSTNYSNN